MSHCQLCALFWSEVTRGSNWKKTEAKKLRPLARFVLFTKSYWYQAFEKRLRFIYWGEFLDWGHNQKSENHLQFKTRNMIRRENTLHKLFDLESRRGENDRLLVIFKCQQFLHDHPRLAFKHRCGHLIAGCFCRHVIFVTFSSISDTCWWYIFDHFWQTNIWLTTGNEWKYGV